MNAIEKKNSRTVLAMAIGLAVCILGSFAVGRYAVPLKELLGILGSRLGLKIAPFWTEQMEAEAPVFDFGPEEKLPVDLSPDAFPFPDEKK